MTMRILDTLREVWYESTNGVRDEIRCPTCGKLLAKHAHAGTTYETKCDCKEKLRIIVR